MSAERHPIWDALDGLQMDLRNAQAKLVTIRSFVAGMDVPDEVRSRCERCGITFAGSLPLAEHVYHSHAGQVPPHWEAIEARSDEPVVDLPPGPPAPVRFTITDGVFSRKARG